MRRRFGKRERHAHKTIRENSGGMFYGLKGALWGRDSSVELIRVVVVLSGRVLAL